MANLVQTEATALLAVSLKAVAYTTPTTPINVRLMSANGSATAAGTEVVNSGGSTYSAQRLDTNLGTASAGSITTSGALAFSNMPAITTVGIEVWDSAGTPVRRWFGALTTSKTTALGDTLNFSSGSITATLS